MLKAFFVAKHRDKLQTDEIDIQELPLPVLNGPVDNMLVTKISFCTTIGNNNGHPAPDPFLPSKKLTVCDDVIQSTSTVLHILCKPFNN